MAPSDGSGNYSRPSGTRPSTGDVVQSAKYNEDQDDIAEALSARIMANGAKAATANIPMGGNKLTGLGAATTNGDAVRYEQWRTEASETTANIVELATTAEAAAGADTARAVTAAGVKSYVDGREATAANILSGADTKLVPADELVSAGAFVTITPDGSNNAATDCATGRNFTVTFNANTTMTAPTNVKVGQVYTYEIVQGTGGSRTATWNSVFKFGDGTATLSTSEGDKDLVSFLAVTSSRFVFLGIRKAIQ